MKNIDPQFIVIDLFCGAGGTTTGFSKAEGVAIVAACVNHDPKAIKSHWMNHPEVEHFEEDIRTLELSRLVRLINLYRAFYPNAKVILWASLECTNFSKAKGGLPRDADSRTLADHLDRYVIALDPDYIQIENVVEFMSWGPLDENGKPISRRNGSDWIKWKNRLCNLGYNDDWREMNAADFGAYTSRNRLFGIFGKPGLPLSWPEPTHAKNPQKATLFSALQKWKPVKDVLDFSDEGKSIFTRKKPLSEKTLQRIYAGLIKYIAGGKDAFMLKYNSTNAKTGVSKGASLDEPCHTITTQVRMNLVQVESAFIAKYYSGKPEGKVNSINDPASTITTSDRLALIQTKSAFLSKQFSGSPESKNISVDQPSGAITTIDHHALIQTSFLQKYYGTGINCKSIEEPCDTIPTNDRFGLVQTKHWVDKTFSGDLNHQSIEQPAGSILSNDHHQLVTAKKWLMATNFNNVGQTLEQPAPVITANRKHHYIVNPQWFGNGGNIENPCCTIIARQDKAPLYLISTEEGIVSIPVFESDSETMVKIKEFMVLYSIVDIKMRMLKVLELLKIQGFPEDYKLLGNTTDQKKFIGNSVEPNVVKCWTVSLANSIRFYSKAA